MGDARLKQTFDEIQRGEDSNVKVFMFDRDKRKFIIDQQFERMPNKTYRFNIPVPAHRTIDDLLCIEHYLTDEQLATVDAEGRRVFLAHDFLGNGKSKDGQFLWKQSKAPGEKGYNPIEILDGGNDKKIVNRIDDEDDCPENCALSKAKLVEHIKNRDEGFDFDLSAFEPLLEVIRKIVEDAENAA